MSLGTSFARSKRAKPKRHFTIKSPKKQKINRSHSEGPVKDEAIMPRAHMAARFSRLLVVGDWS